jgi:hypothetical protein
MAGASMATGKLLVVASRPPPSLLVRRRGVTASLLRKKRPRTARGVAATLSAELPCVAKQQGRRPSSQCVDEIQHEVGPSSSSIGGEVELGTGDLP